MDMNVIERANAAAKKAADETFHQMGGDRGCCGFAWVEIPDGRSQAVRFMRKNGIGKKHWRKGWLVWSPANAPVQSVDVHAAGARAYAKVLQDAGVEAYACSRLD